MVRYLFVVFNLRRSICPLWVRRWTEFQGAAGSRHNFDLLSVEMQLQSLHRQQLFVQDNG